MNGLQELRSTLEEHAVEVHDSEVGGRARSVHARVRTVRRRRRAGAAAGVAAVVALAAGATLLPGKDAAGPEPADRDVVGVTAPGTMGSLGFGYRFSEGVDGDGGRAVVRLAAADEPRLVSWATSGEDQHVTVSGPTLGAPVTFDVADFAEFTLVPAGNAATVRATAADGEPGLAVYRLGDQRPPGVTVGPTTYRETIAGGHLLGAAVSESGTGEVSVPATADGPGLALHYFCSDGPQDAYVHVDYLDPELGGVLEGGGACTDGAAPVDPATLGGSALPTDPGEDVGMRLWVTDGPRGPVVTDPGVRVGLGLYSLDEDPIGPDGYVPARTEAAGHAWRRVDVARSEPGEQRLQASGPSGRGALLAVAYGAWRGGSLRIDFDRHRSGVSLGDGGATQQVVADGGTVSLRVVGGRPDPRGQLGVGFYVVDD